MQNFYKEIFKRKSFHLFRNVGDEKIDKAELGEIVETYNKLDPLYSDIKTTIKIVEAEEVGFKRGGQYCVLLYSEVKDNYLLNIGYLGEQLDLYLVKHNIGTLWFGIGKVEEKIIDGQEFVIMIGIKKIKDESLFRKDMFKSKRKPLEEIWKGDSLGVAEIVRFAPSACNSQPWFVENNDGLLTVYRYKKAGKRGIMPEDKVTFYNRIDLGIFLCFLDICLLEKGINYSRILFVDPGNSEDEFTKVGEYKI